MSIPIRCWCVIAPLLCCFGFVAPAGAVDLVGRTVAVFEWSAASGRVAYYRVEFNRNDDGFQPSLIAASTENRRAGITGKYGESIQVRVQAVGYSGEMSQFSPESETVYFVAPTVDPPADVDHCPNDPAKTEPGICGCGVSDRDTDADGTPNCVETCDTDPAKTSPGVCGCGVSDVDGDADGTPRCHDSCDADPAKTSPGDCGCGVSDVDSDANGTADCRDEPLEGDPAELLDFNADGSADLLIRNPSTGDIDLWLTADPSPGWVQADSLDASFEIVGNADYDGDGYADLLARDPATGHLEIRLLENGEAVETRGFKIELSQDVVGSADYDGNGYADFLLRDRETDELQFWSLHGTNVLEIVQLRDAQNAAAEILASGDYDGDGRHDILWQDRSDFYVWYLDMENPTKPDKETVSGINNSNSVVATGDYDGNRFSDLLLFDGKRGKLHMLLFDSGRPSREKVSDNGLIPRSWDPGDYEVVSSADFDGDGFCDIALRHTSGELLLLYMEGPEALGGLLVGIPQGSSADGVGLENPASE